jgi:hypothetical protein
MLFSMPSPGKDPRQTVSSNTQSTPLLAPLPQSRRRLYLLISFFILVVIGFIFLFRTPFFLRTQLSVPSPLIETPAIPGPWTEAELTAFYNQDLLPLKVVGDLNQDWQVNDTDVALLEQLVAGAIPLAATCPETGDLDLSGFSEDLITPYAPHFTRDDVTYLTNLKNSGTRILQQVHGHCDPTRAFAASRTLAAPSDSFPLLFLAGAQGSLSLLAGSAKVDIGQANPQEWQITIPQGTSPDSEAIIKLVVSSPQEASGEYLLSISIDPFEALIPSPLTSPTPLAQTTNSDQRVLAAVTPAAQPAATPVAKTPQPSLSPSPASPANKSTPPPPPPPQETNECPFAQSALKCGAWVANFIGPPDAEFLFQDSLDIPASARVIQKSSFETVTEALKKKCEVAIFDARVLVTWEKWIAEARQSTVIKDAKLRDSHVAGMRRIAEALKDNLERAYDQSLTDFGKIMDKHPPLTITYISAHGRARPATVTSANAREACGAITTIRGKLRKNRSEVYAALKSKLEHKTCEWRAFTATCYSGLMKKGFDELVSGKTLTCAGTTRENICAHPAYELQSLSASTADERTCDLYRAFKNEDGTYRVIDSGSTNMMASLEGYVNGEQTSVTISDWSSTVHPHGYGDPSCPK